MQIREAGSTGGVKRITNEGCKKNLAFKGAKRAVERRKYGRRGGMRRPIKVGKLKPFAVKHFACAHISLMVLQDSPGPKLSRRDRQELKHHMFRMAPRHKSNAPVISLNTKGASNIRLFTLYWFVYFHPLFCCLDPVIYSNFLTASAAL